MDYNKNIKAGLSSLPIKKMKNEERFLAISAFFSKGNYDEYIKISEINKRGVWNKELLGVKFSYRFYYLAIKNEWIVPAEKNGYFTVAKKGYNHLSLLSGEIESKELRKVGKLIIFNKKATNTFDFYIKNIFKLAKQRILIVDSYVSDVLFDDILRRIPKDVSVKLIYGKVENPDNFKRKLDRFKKEWSKFNVRKNKAIHDRFLIIDNTGYILGPSMKDAAEKSPCILLALDQDETVLLSDFFKELWRG